MLKLRRAKILEAKTPGAPGGEQQLTIELTGVAAGTPRAAIADLALVGPSSVGDEVIVNVEALDLGLGSGGFDIVHVNLTRGLGGAGGDTAGAMKLNYTSLQHAVSPVEEEALELPLERPVAVLALHGQLAAVARAFAQANPGRIRGRSPRCGAADCWPGT
jgi:hypothetical protein